MKKLKKIEKDILLSWLKDEYAKRKRIVKEMGNYSNKSNEYSILNSLLNICKGNIEQLTSRLEVL